MDTTYRIDAQYDLAPQMLAGDLATLLMEHPFLPVVIACNGEKGRGWVKSPTMTQDAVRLVQASDDQPEHIEAVVLG